MKKTTMLLLFIVCICCSLLAMTACNQQNKTDSSNNQGQISNDENSTTQGQTLKHEHNYGEWASDETNHWRECIASGDCDATKIDLEKHSYSSDNDICTVCKFQRNATLIYNEILNGGEVVAYSVSGIENKDVSYAYIPAEHKGKPITSIEESAFNDCRKLASITIGKNVASIDTYVFNCCIKLVEVYNLSSLNIDKGSKDNGYLGYYALDVYTSLDAPSKLSTTNDGYVFYENGEELYLIGYEGNESDLVLPDKYNNKNYAIYKNAFSLGMDENTWLTSVTMPDSIISIGDRAFDGCVKLTNVTIPDSVISIGLLAFGGCYKLESVIIGGKVTSIGDFAFSSCKKLRSVTIGKSVASIGERAFSSCYKLVEVYNLSSLKIYKGSPFNGYVGYYALDINTSLEEPSKLSTTNDGYIFYENGEEVYLVDYIGTETNLILPDKYNNKNYDINCSAFLDNQRIISITIPNGVTSIGDSAFSGCEGLISITIPDSVTSIGDSAFSGCYVLTSIAIPDSVTSIGVSAFSFCIGLTSITIPDNVTSLGNSAFSFCKGLTSVTIGNGIKYIRDFTFDNCLSLTSVTIGKGVTSIGESAFESCNKLTSITIPDSVTEIDRKAFYYCKALTSVTIGKGVKSIGESAFKGCYNLVSVTFADAGNWLVSKMVFGSKPKYINITVIDPLKNADLLKETYTDYYWKKTV